MERLRWIFLIGLLWLCSCSGSQDEGRNYRIGIINPSCGLEEVVNGFKHGMVKRGYKEGENVTYIYNGFLSSIDQVDEQLDKIMAEDVDLIVTMTTPGAKKVKKAVAGTDMPVVFAPVFSPVASGVVASLAKPGGNLTGIKMRGSTAKALDLFLSIAPDTKVIYLPLHYTDKAASQTMEDLEKAAKKMNIALEYTRVKNVEELKAAMAGIPENADAVWLTCSHLIFSNIDLIIEEAAAENLPVVSSNGQYGKGVFMSYGENNFRLGEQASRLAVKILHGVSPADLPVEAPTFSLASTCRSRKNSA